MGKTTAAKSRATKQKRHKSQKSPNSLKPKKAHKTRVTKTQKRDIIKGACTQWIHFCKANRENVIRDNPGITFGEIPRKISTMWKNLTSEEKKPWYDMYNEDKKRYLAQLQNLSPQDISTLKKYKRFKRKKDKERPRVPLSAYMFYVIDVRDNIRKLNPQATFEDIGRKLGQSWNSLNNTNKQKYQILSAKDKDRYEKDMLTYRRVKVSSN